MPRVDSFDARAPFNPGALAEVADAVVTVDIDFCVTWMNPAAERQYGILLQDAVGHPLHELWEYRWSQPEDEAHAFQG